MIMFTTFKNISMTFVGIMLIIGCSNNTSAKNLSPIKVNEYTKCMVHKNSICKTDLHPNNELIATGSSGKMLKFGSAIPAKYYNH
jgi:hypothetical protein